MGLSLGRGIEGAVPSGSLEASNDERTGKAKKQKAMSILHPHKMGRNDQIGYFMPKTWAFWRSLIVCFFLFSIVGHWLEIPYCWFMNECFGVVDADYAVWTDPWWHPYWVYGFGAVVMTLVIEPLKESIVLRRKTLWGAVLETFAIAVVLAMVMELVIGWLVNQPDATGKYPYWDNSEMPLNVFGQAWLVNDVAIGLVTLLYLWVFYPLICNVFLVLKPRTANVVFAVIMVVFGLGIASSYLHLALFPPRPAVG